MAEGKEEIAALELSVDEQGPPKVASTDGIRPVRIFVYSEGT